jgi:glycosyltransferase involved in cell wall biosynthesis
VKIAQVAPLMESVPPKLYGGTERIVSYLTDELVALGHDVTLFASGDSETKAKLEAVWPRALRLDETIRDYLAPNIVMLEKIARQAEAFDVMHIHIDYLGYPTLKRTLVPFLATLHGRLDLKELQPLYDVFDDVPVVSISNSQREPLPQANYAATVYHGLPEALLKPGTGKGGYLAFLGRISPEKAPDAAIRIAGKAGMKIKIAAKIDKVDEDYFNQHIKHLFAEPHVEYIGEINDDQKSEFLGDAAALIFPIAWPEPFGLAMIEAMACGTPVIANNCGSVSEVVDEGVTGFITRNEDQAVAATQKLANIDRAMVRRVFEKRFSARRMAKDYIGVYHQIISAKRQLLETA